MPFADPFLHNSSDFPAGDFGPSWGSGTLEIHFSGGPYGFTGLSPAQERDARRRFEGFGPASGATDSPIEITFRRFPLEAFREVDLSGRDYDFDRRYLEDRVHLAGRFFLASLPRNTTEPAVVWTACDGGGEFTVLFENIFRVMVAYRLLELGGTILHSAAVVRQGFAYLMLGRSGAGKTTFSRMAHEAGWEVLSDDMNAVRFDGDRWIVERLPFAGDLGQTPVRSAEVRLAGLFRLIQSPENRLLEWSKAQAVAKALGCSPVVNDDPYRTDPLLDRLDRLTDAVPTRRLEFSLDGRALSLLPEVLDEQRS